MSVPAHSADRISGEAAISPRRALPIALTLSLGAALSVATFLLVRIWEEKRVENEFDWRARSHAEAMRISIRQDEECLYTLRNLFNSSEDVTFAEFQNTAADLCARHPGIQLLQWLPRVRSEDREAFEKATRSEVLPTFEIAELTGDLKTRSRAADREEYVPVQYVAPFTSHEDALGLDSLSGNHQRAIHRARESGRIAASRRFPLDESDSTEHGWALFLPLYEPGAEPATFAERQERFRGFLQGTFRLSNFVIMSIGDSPAVAVEILLVDDTDGGTQPYLISYANGVWKSSPPPDVASFRTGLHREIHFPVAGRDWTIFIRPAPDWLAAQSTVYPFAFLGTGLLLTALLSSLLLNAQRRTDTVARLVDRRTAELLSAEEALREDIRQRDLIEQALRGSQERYQAFVEQSTEAIWRFEIEPPIPTDLPVEEQVERDFRDAYLAECNDAMARMYGFARSEEIIGRRLHEFLPPSDRRNWELARHFIQNGYRLADMETHEIDREGRPKVFVNNLTGIVEDGLLRRVWGIQRDLTEQKRIEEQRLEQDTRLGLALTATNLGTWEWDLRDHRIFWSVATERMFGLEPGTFDGCLETASSFIEPEDLKRARAVVAGAVSSGRSSGRDHPLRITRRDGSRRQLVSRGAVLCDPAGKAVRLIGTVIDVTDQQQAEEDKRLMERKLQETQKLESLGVLAGGIAHDFNNLLTGILGNASLARMDLPANSPAQPCLEQIEQVTQRAAELCKQMLAYSGKGRFIVQRLDLSAVVQDTADLIGLSISKSAILKYALAKNLPAISADATQLRQIIMNLVINASDAIGEKSGVISVGTGVMRADRAYLGETYLAPDLVEGDYVFLEVSDNGAGMSPETRDRIFDPFFTTKFTGRGLGLAAVLGIVRGHRGALKVYSELGRGTTFKLLLPCAEGPAEPLHASPALHSGWRGSGTMLVVDDEETVRTVTARMLESMGFSVLLATNGREAVEIFQSRAAEIAGVLLDLTMPQLDGSATFTELRRIKPEVRVLLMSGFNEQDAVNRFAGKGLAGFLQKPFKPEALQARLRAIFANPPPL